MRAAQRRLLPGSAEPPPPADHIRVFGTISLSDVGPRARRWPEHRMTQSSQTLSINCRGPPTESVGTEMMSHCVPGENPAPTLSSLPRQGGTYHFTTVCSGLVGVQFALAIPSRANLSHLLTCSNRESTLDFAYELEKRICNEYYRTTYRWRHHHGPHALWGPSDARAVGRRRALAFGRKMESLQPLISALTGFARGAVCCAERSPSLRQ